MISFIIFGIGTYYGYSLGRKAEKARMDKMLDGMVKEFEKSGVGEFTPDNKQIKVYVNDNQTPKDGKNFN